MTVAKSVLLFALAAVGEIGEAWLVWQGVREHRGVAWVWFGVVALAAYGFVATLQPAATSPAYWRPTVASSSRIAGMGNGAGRISLDRWRLVGASVPV